MHPNTTRDAGHRTSHAHLLDASAARRFGRFAAVVLGLLCGPGSLSAQAVTRATRDEIRLIMALEDSLWATSRDQRKDDFAAYLAPGYRGVYPDGIHDRARELALFPDVRMRSYQLQDFVVRPLGPGLYAVTYRATVRGNFQGYDLRGDYWCATVWDGRTGTWLAVLHTETKAPAP
jgi:hypothetical protein